MRKIIVDVCGETGWSIEYVESFPRSIIIDDFWRTYIETDWYKRGEEVTQTESDADKFARLQKEAGVK
jgi:hypothetical protein